MRTWLSRNAVPIGLVLLAAAVVIGAFEALDAFTSSTSPPDEAGDDELTGIASVAGLIKVSLFLGVGALVAIPVRRRLR